jgi:iron complex outermembrane receptor protein
LPPRKSSLKSSVTCLALLPLVLAGTSSLAADDAGGSGVETITVIGTSPLPGSYLDADKLPGANRTLSSQDISRSGQPSATRALNDQLGSVSINDNLDDPFQPDILFRGFEASPVLGTPQGLAVYQNGVRINEAFGDTVNWDLFPDIAIGRADVMSANPVYGLNALGGAVVLTMKNGFTYQGGEAEISGGSWGQRQVSAQYGAQIGPWGLYAAGRAMDEEGWRDFSPDSVRQFYSSAGFHQDGLTLDLSFTGANNRLSGESPTPVQELAVRRDSVFTSPQTNINNLEFVTLNGGYEVNDRLSFQASSYYREFHQSVVNGNTTDYTACADDDLAGSMCQGDGETALTDPKGRLIPDISQGGSLPIGENDFEQIRSVSVGGSLQMTESHDIFGHANHLVVGGGIDSDTTDFHSSAELGVINPALQVTYSGLFVSTPQGTGFTATPVSLNAATRYYGAYLSDTVDVTDALSVTASGRYNQAEIDLYDQIGSALSGKNHYSRFNPAIGFTDKLLDSMTFYAGYAENNRVPTPGEIECSNPAAPCLLPSSLSSDPPNLKQVVSHSYETGLRGTWRTLDWNAGLFRTDVDDDIYGVATSISTGYFQNIGGTRRQGAELGARYRGNGFSVFADYSYIDATFQSDLLMNSPSNPFRDENGNIQVTRGDRLPGIPRHRLKAGADTELLPGWTVGGTAQWVSDSFYRGDEANLMKPLAGYATVNIHSSYDLTRWATVTLRVDNLFNAQYANFGVLGDPTGVNAPGIPTDGSFVDPRFQSPGAPISAFGGVKVRF